MVSPLPPPQSPPSTEVPQLDPELMLELDLMCYEVVELLEHIHEHPEHIRPFLFLQTDWDEVLSVIGNAFHDVNRPSFYEWLQGSAEQHQTAQTIITAFVDRIEHELSHSEDPTIQAQCQRDLHLLHQYFDEYVEWG